MKRVLLFMTAFILSTPGCASRGREARIQTALNVVAQAVDPAYAFAVDACIARESLVATAAEQKQIAPLAADAQLKDIRARCHATRDLFEQIRAAHEGAVVLLEGGKLDEAQAQLDRIVDAWRELKGGAE